MPLAVQIKIDEASLKEAEQVLAAIPGGLNRAIVRSLNRGIDQAFTTYKRGISSAVTLPPTVVGKSLGKKKATQGRMSAALYADPFRAPLGVFEAKQTKISKAIRKKIARGVASRLPGGGVTYRIGRVQKMIEGAFIATAVGLKGAGSRSKEDWHLSSAERRIEWETTGKTPAEIRKMSHRGVFKRRGASRLKIGEKYGPSIWRIIINEPGLKDAMPAAVSVDLNKLLNDQVGVELRNWSKKSLVGF
jgi:hypothetical protein